MTINYIVTNNKIYLKPKFFAFSDGTLQSVFSGNEVYGGYGAVARRGSVNDGVHLIKDNYIKETNGYTYEGLDSGIGEKLEIINNHHTGGKYWSCLSPIQRALGNIVISGNTFQ